MIFGEVLALLALLGAVGAGGAVFWSWGKTAARERAEARERGMQMAKDLRDALNTRDYRKLDDFMVVYADVLTDKIVQHVKQRRDELYLEANP